MKRVLIVEDFPILRDALKAFLELEGYRCEAASNGAEALALLDSGQRVDIIITDNQMPIMNGMAFLSHLKPRFHLSEVPVIMYCGSLTAAERKHSLSMGVVAVLDKPMGFPELGLIVAHALGFPASHVQAECVV